MKTPREILLARHQAASSKLDAVRRGVVNSQFRRRNFAAIILDLPSLLWRELIWPCRFIWTGLAAIWILIFAANFSIKDHSQPAMAKSSPSPEVIVAFRQQQELLAELIGPNDPPIAKPQKPYSPRPSSQRTVEIMEA